MLSFATLLLHSSSAADPALLWLEGVLVAVVFEQQEWQWQEQGEDDHDKVMHSPWSSVLFAGDLTTCGSRPRQKVRQADGAEELHWQVTRNERMRDGERGEEREREGPTKPPERKKERKKKETVEKGLRHSMRLLGSDPCCSDAGEPQADHQPWQVECELVSPSGGRRNDSLVRRLR